MFNLTCTSAKAINAQLDIIESSYNTTYTIENSEDNHKVVICLKNDEQIGKHLLTEYFQKNNEIFQTKTDIFLLHKEYEKIISKLIYKREKRLIA